MGTRAAPNYANIYMGEFEKTYIYESQYQDSITFYKRFIDDIFSVWTGTEKELLEFFTYINSVHPSIKFTYEYSKRNVNFLDTPVYITEEGFLKTDVYHKAVDTHSYLDKSSCHPEHTKKSIPYSQFMRIRRICTDDENFKERTLQQSKYFESCGYSKKELNKTLKQFNNITQNQALEKSENKGSRKEIKTPLVTTYNPKCKNIQTLIDKHWHITQTKENCRTALTEKPSVVTRRNKNLKDYLVRSKLDTGRKKEPNLKTGSSGPCRLVKCSWCFKLERCETFSSRTVKRDYKILHNVNCSSNWVIYLVDCMKCKKQYVGKSKTTLNLRLNNHRSHIKKKHTDCTLTQHYLNTTCDFKQHARVTIIEQMNFHNDMSIPVERKEQILKRREIFWQRRLKTHAPFGLNKREG